MGKLRGRSATCGYPDSWPPPRSENMDSHGHQTTRAQVPRGRVEVLIAEDSLTQAAHLKHLLEGQGFRVVSTHNGKEALEALRRRKPTLVITDIVMPEMDGYELCRQIRADEALADLPLILLTGLSDPED